MGRRELPGIDRWVSKYDQRPDRPLQSPFVVEFQLQFHPAATAEFHDRLDPAATTARPEAAGDRRHSAAATGDRDVTRRQELVLRSRRRDRSAGSGAADARTLTRVSQK